MSDFDVVVVGAGAAGLAALAELDRAGCRVVCLEARDRIGGRIFTEHDPLSPLPIELGAEFIHGRPPEIFQIARASALGVYDCADASLHIKNGVVQKHEDAWEPVGHLMQEMRWSAARGIDEPFSTFLARSSESEDAKELSTSFVEGFNAARKEIIGIASLAKDGAAADAINGDQSFRFHSGYDSVVHSLLQKVSDASARLRLNTSVQGIEWRRGLATLTLVSQLTGATQVISATRVLVTVPLGVLTAASGSPGSIWWKPAPESTLRAASALAFGQVVRVILRFREAFWEENSRFADVGFLLSNEKLFPTWWTTLAVRAPIVTGWSAGPHADDLLGKPHTHVIGEAVESLARILATKVDRVRGLLEAAYFHDWHADPFTRGAYSYVPAGALAARETLAEPVDNTLYFAGEATELNGHSATVHGAIASGRRAARQIIEAA